MDLNEFLKITEGKSRIFFSMPVGICIKRYGERYKEDAEMILSFVENLTNNLGLGLKQVINMYFEFVNGQIKMHKEFLIEGHYNYSREKQVESIINSKEFQINNIFILALSYVLAPHRYELFRYVRSYIKHFIKPGDVCLEIGTGTGLDCFMVGLHGAFIETYDLNPYSSLCLELLGSPSQVRFFQKYYLFNEEEKYDHCLLIEILEHLEKPLEFLQSVNKILKTGGKAILTFAIRMPQIDHIYLFNSVTQARNMIAKTKLGIIDQDYFISSFMDYDISKKEILAESSEYPANYACVVKKVG